MWTIDLVGRRPLPLCVYVYVWWVLRRACEETSSIPESTLCRNKVIMVCHLQCFGLAVSFSIDYLPSPPSPGSWGQTDISLTSHSAWWWFRNILMFVRVLSGLIIFSFHIFLDLWKKWLSYQNNYTHLDFRYTPQRDISAVVVLLKQEFCKILCQFVEQIS